MGQMLPRVHLVMFVQNTSDILKEVMIYGMRKKVRDQEGC
jgi:hypothetical protein